MAVNFATRQNVSALGLTICILGAIFYCYEFLLRIEPSVMVPELMRAFQVGAAQLGTMVACYYFIYTPMQIVVGVISDLYGPRLVLTAAVLICALGSFIFGSAHALAMAAVGRVLIGFGSAFAFVGVLKLAASWLPLRFFAMFAGFATALGMIGAMVGDIALSSLVHNIGWQRTVNVGTILGIGLVPIMWLIVRDAPQLKKVTIAPCYREIGYGLLAMLKNKQMWLNGLIGCIMYLSLSLFAELWGIQFLSNVYHLSAQNAASACSMVFLGWLLGSPLTGYLSDQFLTRRKPLALGCIGGALIISAIIYFPLMSLTLLYILLFLFGVFASSEVICFAVKKKPSTKVIGKTLKAY